MKPRRGGHTFTKRAAVPPSSRTPIPLVARLKFAETNETLRAISAPLMLPSPPQMAPPISRRALLVDQGIRILLLWKLEAHHASAGTLRSSPEWPTQAAHRCGEYAPEALEILADSASTWRDFLEHGVTEPRTGRSALAVAAIHLAGQGKTEDLLEGVDDDAIADIVQVGRQQIPPELLGTDPADLTGHPGAEDARLGNVPLVIHTRSRIEMSDQHRLLATLLDARSRGHLARAVHWWPTRTRRAFTLSAEQLLDVSLEEADEAWHALRG